MAKDYISEDDRFYQTMAAVKDASIMAMLGFAFFSPDQRPQTYVSDTNGVISEFFYSHYGIHPSHIEEVSSEKNRRVFQASGDDGTRTFLATIKTNKRGTKALNLTDSVN